MIALITGASGGIGLELARLFADDGHDLVLVARGGERLATVARDLEERFRVEVRPIPRDLSNPIAPLSLFDECGEVDILVNNAGFGHHGSFADEDPALLGEMLQVNIAALTQLTRHVPAGDGGARGGQDPERGVDGGVPAGAADGGVLRQQGVRAVVLGGDPGRAARGRA